mmetsp:Transcript_82797/g.229900  ORF Transcript_82797/g.229900 Transcript_82797/m.229900 type:complete len:253 (-) Transcript_82797:2-760(-)
MIREVDVITVGAAGLIASVERQGVAPYLVARLGIKRADVGLPSIPSGPIRSVIREDGTVTGRHVATLGAKRNHDEVPLAAGALGHDDRRHVALVGEVARPPLLPCVYDVGPDEAAGTASLVPDPTGVLLCAFQVPNVVDQVIRARSTVSCGEGPGIGLGLSVFPDIAAVGDLDAVHAPNVVRENEHVPLLPDRWQEVVGQPIELLAPDECAVRYAQAKHQPIPTNHSRTLESVCSTSKQNSESCAHYRAPRV